MIELVKIEALPNGAHENLVRDEPAAIEPGWAVVPINSDTLPNFPFGSFEVEDIDGVPHMVADSWEPLPLPEPETLTPAQQRKEAYTTRAVIPWGGELLTVTEAAREWQYYAAEGDAEKADELQGLIAVAKQAVREEYPDEVTPSVSLTADSSPVEGESLAQETEGM